jgi:hypothetical protein
MEILRRAKEGDVDVFTDYYFRTPTSGTWWLPGAATERWRVGYERLHAQWLRMSRPDEFAFLENTYQTHMKHDKSREFPDQPAFHHHHGLLMLPYQKMLHNDRHPIRTIIGGMGSAKTYGQAISLLIHAATLDGFRAFALGPRTKQAQEIHKIALQIVRGTLYEERFLLRSPVSPNATLYIGHELIGENTIECYPIENNVVDMRTLTADMAIVDQAEKLDDLQEVILSIGSRFRGRVIGSGRERIGTLTFIANSEENTQLWEIYDKAEEDPDGYLSYSPSTYDNPFLTDKDIWRYELQFGQDEEQKRVHFLGQRPIGNGSVFSRETLMNMQSPALDQAHEIALAKEIEGAVQLQTRGVGVYEWALPYAEGRQYLVISDPGTQNPPERDSPVIFVWDITDFPTHPATLTAFLWVYGKRNIDNWAVRYAETVHKYRAYTSNGFDATGFQAGYDQWIHILEKLSVEKINLGGNRKALCINAARMLTAKRLVQMPVAVRAVYEQLARYELPEPPRLRQDITMAFVMSCWWMQRLYYMTIDTQDNEASHIAWLDDRLSRVIEERDEIHVY